MLTRKTPLRRTPWVRHSTARPRRPRRAAGPVAAVVLAVLTRAARDGRPCCEVCGNLLIGDRGYGWSLHHRRGRDGSTGQHDAANQLAVCGGSNVDRCHGVIHSDRRRAEANGWSITRNADVNPLTVAVLVDNGQRRVFLTAEGGYREAVDPPDLLSSLG